MNGKMIDMNINKTFYETSNIVRKDISHDRLRVTDIDFFQHRYKKNNFNIYKIIYSLNNSLIPVIETMIIRSGRFY